MSKSKWTWKIGWQKLNKPVGLYFVCRKCGQSNSLITPAMLANNGTPQCPECDIDMAFEDAYISKEM